MTSVERYVKKARSGFKVRPGLPFGVALDVGVIGRVVDGQFVRVGTAKSVLDFEIGNTTAQPGSANWQMQSGRDIGINFLAEGQAAKAFPNVPSIGVRVEVSFKKDDSFLAVVEGPTTHTLADPYELMGSIMDAYRRNVWLPDFVLVYEVVRVESALVLLSKQANTQLLLAADVELAPDEQDIAELAGNLKITHQSNEVIRFDGAGGMNLYYNAYRVKRSVWTGRVSVEPFALDQPADVFQQV